MDFTCCGNNKKKNKCINTVYSFLRVIADKNRLQILCVLQNGPRCVCEVVEILEISEKLASHHLKQLKTIGLLDEKREGNFIRYSLNDKAMREYKKILNQLI